MQSKNWKKQEEEEEERGRENSPWVKWKNWGESRIWGGERLKSKIYQEVIMIKEYEREREREREREKEREYT